MLGSANELRERLQCLALARLQDEGRGAALAPGGQPVGDARAVADERDLVDEGVGHGRDRVALASGEVVILDRRRLGLEAVPLANLV